MRTLNLLQVLAFKVKTTWFAIVRLNFLSFPTTIAWFIISVVVFAFQCQCGMWSSAHVFDKSGKAVAPTLTHGDPTATISMIAFVPLVRTASDHSRPHIVFGPAMSASGGSMRETASAIGLEFTQNTSATLNAQTQIRTIDRSHISTVTLAQPPWTPRIGISRSSDHCKPTEPFPDDVPKRWHYMEYCSTHV